ncbi:sorbin and SH3 domain-containing protein 2-like isoform X1 [Lytechinus pictus]|uniref:sorbin and SH3 domain-containing protein 2-like isoform X1 n=1 Tax=Lytechinus pictus TaxID=7653 RepID=UPI0030BA1B2D
MNQFPAVDKNISEKKPRPVREPDASYNKSLPEYLPIKSPSISDDRFDDFDFSPPVTVTATKQEVLPKVERTPSLEYKLTRASAIALYPFTAQSKKELSFKKGDTIYLTREIDNNWLEGEHHGNKGILPRTYVEIVTSIEEARNLQANAPSAEGKGRAKYKFKGETANELSVNKGDIIDLVRKIDANWWEVRHGNKAGIVPVAYLDVLREPHQGISSPVPKSLISSSSGRGPLSPTPRSPSVQAPRSPSAQAPRSPSTQAPRSPSTQVDNPIQYTSPYLTDTPAVGRSQPSQQHRPGQGPRDGVQRGMQPAGGRQTQNAGSRQRLPDGERFRAVYSYKPGNDDELEIREGETVVVMEKCDDGWFVGYSESTGQFGTFPGNYVEKL